MYFLKLAFLSILKNKRNTFTILLVVFICVLIMEFTVGYMDGFKKEMMDDALLSIGHVVIYNKDFYENLDFKPLEFNIEYNEQIEKLIKETPNVATIRPEINFGAIANSKDENLETFVKAIDLTKLSYYDKKIKSVIKGRFIENDREFVVGYKAAELLKADIGESLILFTMDRYGSINAIEGKIVGFIRTNIFAEDKAGVFCSLKTAQDLLGMDGRVTEILITVNDFMGYDYKTLYKIDNLRKKAENTKKEREKEEILNLLKKKYPLEGAEKTANDLQKKFFDYIKVIPWQVDQSYLVMMLNIIDIWIVIILGIILFVAAMGISNSFLMNIMGRMPEFGVLRAMGLSTNQLFGMILSESFLLGLSGTILGIIPGIILVYYFQIHPIDYSAMAETFAAYEGLDAIIGTYLSIKSAVYVFITGVLISIFASIYPAYIAIKKKPVEVIRMTT